MLSDKNKQKLINYVKKNLTIETIEGGCYINNPIPIFKYKNFHPIFIKYMYEYIEDNFIYTQDELIQTINSEKYYNTELYKMFDIKQHKLNANVYCINKLFDEIPLNKFKFTFNVTDYVPCDNILIKVYFENIENPWNNNTNLQIRKDDFPFNQGECYGLHTDFIKEYKLTDGNFTKYCKRIGINL